MLGGQKPKTKLRGPPADQKEGDESRIGAETQKRQNISKSLPVGEKEQKKDINALSALQGGVVTDEIERRESMLKSPPLKNSSQSKSFMRSRSATPRGRDSHSKNNYYGIDIGCGFIVLSLCDINNVSIVLENELSKRKTYAGICFRDKSRFVGSAVEKMQIRDCENTVTSFKPYFGKNWNEIAEEIGKKKGKNPESSTELPNGIGYKVKYYSKERYYTIDQFYLTLLSKLRDTIEYNISHLTYFTQFKEEENEKKNIILSVPSYYTNKQTILLNEYCNLLKMNCDGIIPDYLATAITFGYNNKSRFDGERCYLFVDIGYSCCNCTVVKYHQDSIKEEYGLEVLSHEHTQKLNGELIDEKITDYLLDIIKNDKNDDNGEERWKDINKNLKLYTKLVKGAIDGKEKLTPTMINVDGLFDDGDEDFQHEFHIEELNKILLDNDFIQIFNEIIKNTVKNAVEAAGKMDATKMEIVIAGGTTRIPIFQQVLTNHLQNNHAEIQTLNLTLNMDECVSTGCSYYDAILHNVISYNIKDKYSGIIIDSSNIKEKKTITSLLSKIKNYIFFKLDKVVSVKVKSQTTLYYINCYKYYIQFYILLHQNDINCKESFVYIYDELKDVVKLLISEMKEYKCESTTLKRPETYKSVFSSLFEDNKGNVKLTNIDNIITSLADKDKSKLVDGLKELKGDANRLGQNLVLKIKQKFPAIKEASLEILKKITNRESYSIIISLLLDLLSFKPEEVNEVEKCLTVVNELVDHINNYTTKNEEGVEKDLLTKYCNELYSNEDEILTNEKNNREISSLKNEMETKIYAYKDKITKYNLKQFEEVAKQLDNILSEIKAKKNNDQPLKFFKDKENEMNELCKDLETVIEKIQIEIHIDSTLKDREPVAKAHHLDELKEYQDNYNKFRKWVNEFNKNINNSDLKEITTKEDFDKFIIDLDEAVDSIKDFKSLYEKNQMRLKYLSKTIVVNNALTLLYDIKRWIEDKSRRYDRKLSEYKRELDKLKQAVNAVLRKVLKIGDRVIDGDKSIGIITKIHDDKQQYDVLMQLMGEDGKLHEQIMIEEIDDIYPYDSNYNINPKEIGSEVEFIPKGSFEKIKGIIESKNPDGTYNIKYNIKNNIESIDYYEEDISLGNGKREGEDALFKLGDIIEFTNDEKSWDKGIIDSCEYDDNGNTFYYIGYTELERINKRSVEKDDNSKINIRDVVKYIGQTYYGNYFRINSIIDNNYYKAYKIHSNAYPIDYIRRIFSPNEKVSVLVNPTKGWQEGSINSYNGNGSYYVNLKITDKPITLDYKQIKPFVDSSKSFENDKVVIYKTKSQNWEKGIIKGNDSKTYTIVDNNTKTEEKGIEPYNIRLYDNEYNPFYYKNDEVLIRNEKGEVERRILNEDYVSGSNYSLYLDNNEYNIHDRIEYLVDDQHTYTGEILRINHNYTFNIYYEIKMNNISKWFYSEMVSKSSIKPILDIPTIKMNNGENMNNFNNYQLCQHVKTKTEKGWIEGEINRIHNYLYDIYSSNNKILLKDVKYSEIYPCYYIDSVYRVGDTILYKEKEYKIIQIVNDNIVKLMNIEKNEMIDVDIKDIELKDGLEYEENEPISYYHYEYRNYFEGIITKKLDNNKYVIQCSNTEIYKNVKPEYMEKKSESKFMTNVIVKINKKDDDEGIIIRELKGKKYLVYHKNDYEVIEENKIEIVNEPKKK